MLFNPDAKLPTHPNTDAPVKHVKERMQAFLDKHAEDTVIVPESRLAELRAGVQDIQNSNEAIKQYPFIKIADFDEKCAIELSIIIREAMAQGDKKSGA